MRKNQVSTTGTYAGGLTTTAATDYTGIYGPEITEALNARVTLYSLIPLVGEEELWQHYKKLCGWKFRTKARKSMIRTLIEIPSIWGTKKKQKNWFYGLWRREK